MALSIGTLVGYLQLDDTAFTRSADKADRKMDALRLHLQALERVNPKIKVEVTTQTARLDELKARLVKLRAQAADGVDVKVDMVRTLLELDAVQAKLRGIQRQALAAREEVSLLGRAAEGLGKVRGPSLLWTAILGLSPLLIPLGGAATAAFGAIAAGALGAVAGVGVLKLALSGLGDSIKAYQTYQTAMANATTPAQRQAAQAALNKSAYGTASQPARAFSRYYGQFTSAFDLKGAAQDTVLPGLTDGMRAATRLAVPLSSAVTKVGTALGDLASKGGHALSGPFWRQWIAWLGGAASKDLRLLGDAGGHFVEAIARAVQRFGPDGTRMLTWVDTVAKKFDGWTGGKGFSKFLDTIRKDASQVGDAFRAAGPVLVRLFQGMSQVSAGEMAGISGLFTVIGAIPPVALRALGEFLPVFILGLKGMQIAGAVAAGVKALGVALTFLAANPIGLAVTAIAALVLGLIYAYKHSETFRNIVNGAFHVIATAAKWMWNDVLKPTFRFVVGAFLAMAGSIVHGAAWAFGWIPGIGGKLKGAAKAFDSFAAQVNNALNSIPNNKNVNLTYNVLPGKNAANPLYTLPLTHAHALGTNDAPGGWARINENGPELVLMPKHAQVLNSARTSAILQGQGRAARNAGPVAFRITNWHDGTGHFQNIAQSTVLSEMEYAAAIGGN